MESSPSSLTFYTTLEDLEELLTANYGNSEPAVHLSKGLGSEAFQILEFQNFRFGFESICICIMGGLGVGTLI